MNGLEHQTIKRLTRTWAKLTKTNWIIYNDLQNVKSLIKMNNSTITVQPPCVPDFVQQIERMQTAYDLPKHEKPNTSSNELKSIKKKSKHTYMIDLSRYAKIGAVIDVLGTYAMGTQYKENKEMQEYFRTTIHITIIRF
ncbi:hypothetical protein QTN25_000870 [Entamoeba marina]